MVQLLSAVAATVLVSGACFFAAGYLVGRIRQDGERTSADRLSWLESNIAELWARENAREDDMTDADWWKQGRDEGTEIE